MGNQWGPLAKKKKNVGLYGYRMHKGPKHYGFDFRLPQCALQRGTYSALGETCPEVACEINVALVTLHHICE